MAFNFDKLPNRRDSESAKWKYYDEDVLPMWVADMDIETRFFVMDAIRERVKHSILGYEEIPDSMFDSQIEWIINRHAYEMKREWMFYSPSVVASINLCIQAFTEVGDKVIVQSPVYFPFYSSVTNNDRVLVKNTLKEDNGYYSMDFEALEDSIDEKTRLLQTRFIDRLRIFLDK